MDDALQAAMLFAKVESLPDLRAATLDEIFAVGVRLLVVDYELNDLVGPIVAAMPFDKSIDGGLDFEQLSA